MGYQFANNQLLVSPFLTLACGSSSLYPTTGVDFDILRETKGLVPGGRMYKMFLSHIHISLPVF